MSLREVRYIMSLMKSNKRKSLIGLEIELTVIFKWKSRLEQFAVVYMYMAITDVNTTTLMIARVSCLGYVLM